jgi:hypothetical protein
MYYFFSFIKQIEIETFKESYEKNKKATIGGAFKSGKFHAVYFEKNPYLTDKDGPVNRESKRSKSESDLKPFKQTSPPKTVI